MQNEHNFFSYKYLLFVFHSGMILYNGQRRTTGADFVSLGLVGGRLEFRSAAQLFILNK